MLRARYRRIIFFFGRVIIGLFIVDIVLPRLGFRKWVRRSRPARLGRIAASFRMLAVQMGGVMIKVGQFLSSRLDVLPDEIVTELAQLQDQVPPEDPDEILRLVEAELGATLGERFVDFDVEPMAAASLGQVHRAEIKTTAADGKVEGEIAQVVVKVQRPDIERIVATDLAALRTVCQWLRRYPPIRKRVDLPALFAEFSRVLYEEIDYLNEGRNAETFAAYFRDRPKVRVPAVHWTHTTRRVLTLEDVYDIKITDYEAITAAGVDRAAVAQHLFDTYLRQIFEDGFFHADPHPGNLFVSPGEGGDWQLTFVDFGMAGRVPPNLRAGLREFLIAAGTKDAVRAVKSYQMMGFLLPHADLDLLAQMESIAVEQFWGKSMAELRQIDHREMHQLAYEFRQVIYEMPFQFPQDLVLLGRTVAILFGMCTGLDSQFNVWERVTPFAEVLISEEVTSGWRVWLGELGSMARAMLALPRQAEAVLGQMERGSLAVQVPGLAERADRVELTLRRMTGAVIFAALMTSGVQLYLAEQGVIGGALLVSAGLTLIWVIFVRPAKTHKP